MADQPPPQLTLYSFDCPDPKTPHQKRNSLSPFVSKLQFRLRHAGISYVDAAGSKPAAPRGKIPYVKFAEDGKVVGDTGFIVRELAQRGLLISPNDSLEKGSKTVRGEDYSLKIMVEGHLYWFLMYERWKENYPLLVAAGPFAHLRFGLRRLATKGLQGFLRGTLYFQGVGRYSFEEVGVFMREGVEVLGGYARRSYEKMGEDKGVFWILGGKEATEADFSCWGFLVGVLVLKFQPVLRRLVMEHEALVEYVRRSHDRYFGDYRDFEQLLKEGG
ncbi:hypothetical protein B0T21DRAFT_412741 [Apiosordaria backusii]|uniref:Thioredoxin-like fold domain-containing protein n=1 Tax=Apiosordaria backusii TaxID=314023 RepID=A0AA40BE33_9PEZI|nr:hypothetical protein B0T21DRAFT_412741 [Apiosordaria backusii]